MYQPLTCLVELNRMLQGTLYSRSQIDHVARRLLSDMFAYANRHVAYYSDCLNEPTVPLDEPVEVLRALPVLTKEILRSEVSRLRSARWRWLVKRNTSGGSTGEPAVFYQDARYRRWNRAAKLVFDTWSGVHLNHTKAILWAAQSDVRASSRGIGRLKSMLKKEISLNAYSMDEVSMSAYLDVLERQRPDQLMVYAESGYELARFALARGRRIQGMSAVMSSAGTLFPDMRAKMEEAFGAPVFNRYGSREVGDVACECSAHAGLHVNPFTHFVEILREDGSEANPGELGRVVVTSLTNYAMPLIRYEIDDLASWATGDCPCGCNWPLLEKVEGRVTDHVKSANGALVYGAKLRHLLFHMDYIKKYRWVQESVGAIRLLVVLDRDAVFQGERWKRDLIRLETDLREALGADCLLTIEVLEEIPPSASGKHRYVVSNVV